MSDVFSFGPDQRYALDVRARTLHAAGRPLAVGTRAFDLLLALVEADGELLTKEQLLARCWPGLVVEEANVHVQVSQLRKLLGAQAITTVQGLGYRLVGPVRRGLATPPAHNLPSAHTGFVGREQVLHEARARLDATRLLTFIGIGGTGKTRLALQLGWQLLPQFRDGVWWVDLAPVDKGEQVVSQLLQGLDIKQVQHACPHKALADWLRDRDLLLVLDNCEHVLDAVAALVDTCLTQAPRLRVLTTSREALGVPGEAVFPVRPMALPLAGDAEEVQRGCEAMRLFLDRASAALGATPFVPTGADLAATAEVCRRVDGIPLALELAAAQLRVVSPGQLLDLLHARFRVLVGSRRALSRQQTMQAIIQWSYEHLRDEERQLLMALAMCSGGCDLDAAADLVQTSATSPLLLSGLARLVEQSLVNVHHGPAKTRYLLLETVRQFALEQLQGLPLAAVLRERHVAHYLARAERHEAIILRHGDSAASLADMDLERENLLRAIDVCAHDDSPRATEQGLRLVAALRHYWTNRGQNAIGLQVTLAALRHAGQRPVDDPHLLALRSAVWMHNACGHFEDGLSLGCECLRLAAQVANVEHTAEAHRGLGISLRALGRIDEAVQAQQQALLAARSLGQDKVIGDALQSLCVTYLWSDRVDEASALAEEVLALRRRCGHGDHRLAEALLNAGRAAGLAGEVSTARVHLLDALQVLPRVGAWSLDIELLDHVGRLAAQATDWQPALTLHAASLALARDAGLVVMQADDRAWQAARQAADTALGTDLAEQARARGATLDLTQAMQLAAAWLRTSPTDRTALPQHASGASR